MYLESKVIVAEVEDALAEVEGALLPTHFSPFGPNVPSPKRCEPMGAEISRVVRVEAVEAELVYFRQRSLKEWHLRLGTA